MPKGPVIPASDRLKKFLGDLYTGTVPNRFEQAINPYVQPVSKFINNLISPLDPDTGLPNVDVAGPVMVGKTGARNAARILLKIKAQNPPSAAAATVAYLREKYPKIMNLMDNKLQNVTNPSPNVGPLEWGIFNPETNSGYIYDKGINQTMRQYANTGAHEGYHGYQWNYGNRRPEMVPSTQTAIKFKKKGPKTKQEFQETVQGSYEPAELSNEYFENKGITDLLTRDMMRRGQFQKYQKQPVEREARVAGETGARTFRNFADQILPPRNQKVLDFSSPEFMEVMQDYFNQGGKGAPHMMDLLPILRQKGYTSFRNEGINYPVHTPESLLGLPDSPRYWE